MSEELHCTTCGRAIPPRPRWQRKPKHPFCSRSCWAHSEERRAEQREYYNRRGRKDRLPALRYDPDLNLAVLWARRTGMPVPFRCAESELPVLHAQLARRHVPSGLVEFVVDAAIAI